MSNKNRNTQPTKSGTNAAKPVEGDTANTVATATEAPAPSKLSEAGGDYLKTQEAEAGTYVCAYPLPHPTKANVIYPAAAGFEVSEDDLAEDAWILMQVETGVFIKQ